MPDVAAAGVAAGTGDLAVTTGVEATVATAACLPPVHAAAASAAVDAANVGAIRHGHDAWSKHRAETCCAAHPPCLERGDGEAMSVAALAAADPGTSNCSRRRCMIFAADSHVAGGGAAGVGAGALAAGTGAVAVSAAASSAAAVSAAAANAAATVSAAEGEATATANVASAAADRAVVGAAAADTGASSTAAEDAIDAAYRHSSWRTSPSKDPCVDQ